MMRHSRSLNLGASLTEAYLYGLHAQHMRKFDACVGREARINKLLLKKPPGLMSTSGASLDEPLRAMKERKKMGRREM